MADDEDFISLMPSKDNEEEEEEEAKDDENDGSNDKQQARSQQLSQNFDRSNGLPPWMDDYVDHRRVTPMVALHNEIVGFTKLMEPRPDEMKMRNDLVKKFTALAESIFQNCKVEVFGSQVTG